LQQSKTLLEKLDENECLSEKAFTDYHLAWVLSQTGRPDIGRQLYEKSGGLYERLGDQWNLANVFHSLGVLLWDQSKYTRSQEYINRSLKIKEKIGDSRGIAALLSWSGLNAIFQGDYQGESLIRKSVAIYTELGERIRVLEGIQLAGIALMVLGRFEETRTLMEELGMADDRIYLRGDSNQSILASALIHLGRYDEARDHTQKGLALARKMGDPYSIGFANLVTGWLAIHDGDYILAEHFLWEGASVCEEHKIMDVYCWALATGGFAAHQLGKAGEARKTFIRANNVSLEIDSLVGKVFSLILCLPILIKTGHAELALEINNQLQNYPMIENSVFFRDLIDESITGLTAAQHTNAAKSGIEIQEKPNLDMYIAQVQEILIQDQ
jgi:tetratricopeptide (TPR) repeat protein